jgi:hypothetical protein
VSVFLPVVEEGERHYDAEDALVMTFRKRAAARPRRLGRPEAAR